MFGTILILVCTLMHAYVFWRTLSLPIVRRFVGKSYFIGTNSILWILFVLGRIYGHSGSSAAAQLLEFIGMNWMAVLFLIFIPLFAVDLVTLFGFFISRRSTSLRGYAVLVGLFLSIIAFIQGMRPPVIKKYEVTISELPASLDGKVLVALSDMHIGSQLGEKWLTDRVAQVNALRPDLVVLLGDIFEGHCPPESHLITALKQLSAPMGVWAVPGNHEFHGSGNINFFKGLKFKLLRNVWAEVTPGLIIAGFDDLTNNRRNGSSDDIVISTFSGDPTGAVILLSHTPWEVEKAAKMGVDLMLSGHTHGGQIWPFDFVVQQRYPLLEGRYEVGDMTVIVCRGTGTWGPRMRLWSPGEILQITLKKESASP